ncbi:toll/interleukin-1 receptor domain-containing protein [Kocuria rhizophila]|uniref:toll/interleukin-1 receptor domain-containing protein n=1 Tax=Kocuria rhizophila TaxID=72000 RepID=UPI0021A7DE16|nr:toll/interleukin-1 receptor domain-containing protein [Kocuria rhizophila]MCT1544946.1 TIR domain-containing protein [Kocuria rhizophila]MCT2171151.1 TIR domain-containing protein [Kocuria rhizophila]
MSHNQFKRQVREAQRKAQREIDRVDHTNKKAVDDYNREMERHNRREIERVNRKNKKAVDDYNRRVDQRNREVNRHNQKVVDDIKRQLTGRARPTVSYRPAEQALAERVQGAINFDDGREYDVFLSYARIDGEAVASELARVLEALGVRVWFDAVAIQPGKSQSLQMDAGLRKASAGIAVLTAAYLAGRFWTQRELGALLNKPTLIPVLHGVTFDDVKEHSGILPDLAGFTTADDEVSTIAEKIAPFVSSHPAEG